jgi:plasmid replication initiation protein
MNANFFSLTKKRRTKDIFYTFRNGDYLKVYTTHELGLATIYDLDILLFLISQLVKAKDDGVPLSNRIHFTGGDFFTFTGTKAKGKKRSDGGDAYTKLYQKLTRLHNTHIETSLSAGGQTNFSFNWLSEIKEHKDEQGRHKGYEVVIADFLYQAVKNDTGVLTLDPRYFRLTGALERYLYLFLRKSAGNKGVWTETLESIYKKSGSIESFTAFKSRIKKILARHNENLLGYRVYETLDGRTLKPQLTAERSKFLPNRTPVSSRKGDKK